jgi:uncharacterized membrane protein
MMMLWLLQKEPQARPLPGALLTGTIDALLRTPHDAERVAAARQAHKLQRRKKERYHRWTRAMGIAFGVVLITWLVWEALMLHPDQTEAQVAHGQVL